MDPFKKLLAVMVAATVAPVSVSVAKAQEKLRVGVQIAQTGNAAVLGVPALKGIRFTADAINKAGGLSVGGKKYMIELLVRDDGSSPETARAVVQQLITEDKVDVLIAGVATTVVASVMPIVERYGVPAVTTFAYAPGVLPAKPKFGFVNVMTVTDQFQGPLAFLKENGVSTVALAATNDDLGEGFIKAMPRFLEEYGLKLGGIERFEKTITNFGPVMTRLKALKADALIVEAGNPLSFQFRVAQKQYQACDAFKFTVYEYGPPLQPTWVDSTKAAAPGAIGQTFWWKTQKGFEDRWFGNNAGFVKAFKEGTGEDPSWAVAQGVQSMELMALAVEKAGTLDKEAIAKAFVNLDGSTLFGPIKFDPETHFNRGFVKHQVVIQQQGLTSQDAKIIAPADQAEAKFIKDTCGN